jgi:hypothetical protein
METGLIVKLPEPEAVFIMFVLRQVAAEIEMIHDAEVHFPPLSQSRDPASSSFFQASPWLDDRK